MFVNALCNFERIFSLKQSKVCQSDDTSIGLSDHMLTRKVTQFQVNKHKNAKCRSMKFYSNDQFVEYRGKME